MGMQADYDNEAFGLIRSGLEGAAKQGQQFAAGYTQRAAAAKPLTRVEKWAAEMMMDGFTPQEVAAAAKAGMGPGEETPPGSGGGAASGAAGGMPSEMPSEMPQGGAIGGAVGGAMGGVGGGVVGNGMMPSPSRRLDPTAAPSGGMAAQAAGSGGMTGGMGSTSRPPVETRADYDTVMGAAPIFNRIDTNRIRREGEEGRDARAGLAETGKNSRAAERRKFDREKLEESSRQFDDTLKFKYADMENRMKMVRANVQGRIDLQAGTQDSKFTQKLLESDAAEIKSLRQAITSMSDSAMDAVAAGIVDPETMAGNARAIKAMRDQLEYLETIHNLEVRRLGGRQSGGEEIPGSTPNDRPPMQGPTLSGQPTQERRIDQVLPQRRVVPVDPQFQRDEASVRGRSGGNLDAKAPTKLDTSTDIQAPKMIHVRDRKTGKTIARPAEELEEELRKTGTDRWLEMFEIAGVE